MSTAPTTIATEIQAKSSAGIIFGVSQIRGQAQMAEVFSAADRMVEQKKL